MAGRHRKPSKFEALGNYATWAAIWGLVVACIVLLFFMIKDMF